jgi:hypothetical protein
MNVQGDFRYVTPAGFLGFADVAPEGTNPDLLRRFIERARGRAAAFLPGGRYARQLAERDTILQVGTTVFAHGGVSPVHVDYGIGRINAEIRGFMQGKMAELSSTAAGSESPIWTRDYGMPEPRPGACDQVSRTLELLSAERLVVGHTVQNKGISSACNGKVWRIDVGLARYYGGTIGALEIRGSEVRALTDESKRLAPEIPAGEPRAP